MGHRRVGGWTRTRLPHEREVSLAEIREHHPKVQEKLDVGGLVRTNEEVDGATNDSADRIIRIVLPNAELAQDKLNVDGVGSVSSGCEIVVPHTTVYDLKPVAIEGIRERLGSARNGTGEDIAGSGKSATRSEIVNDGEHRLRAVGGSGVRDLSANLECLQHGAIALNCVETHTTGRESDVRDCAGGHGADCTGGDVDELHKAACRVRRVLTDGAKRDRPGSPSDTPSECGTHIATAHDPPRHTTTGGKDPATAKGYGGSATQPNRPREARHR